MLCTGVFLMFVILAFIQLGVTLGITCDDGSPAAIQVSTVYNGTEMGIWSCVGSSAALVSTTTNITARSAEKLNLCPAKCTTLCRKPNQVLLDMQDCHDLAKYYADSGRFTVKGHQYMIWAYRTCKVTQYNHLDRDISYCYGHHNWAGTVDHITSKCRTKRHHNGGTCHFYDDSRSSSVIVVSPVLDSGS
ncbi:hypothetical protein BDZ94DRAFT_906909 [Collybia nuda]|uniref:Secreted protein n=1 Tax=Collybia nuda TaxID=64659 RepID=A0A9P6CIV5_9AGAR|nr:hypothetical protein BDZ94DRAFT_906909 [Collybia nuda]